MKQLQILGSTVAVGLLSGSASALFLACLGWVSNQQDSYTWLLWLLPLGGAIVGYLYMKLGQSVSRGNNLVIEHAHRGDGRIPLRMAPLVLFGTLLTHLFGGSAGREGTAVQISGSLSSWVGQIFRLDTPSRRLIILSGISGGFGSVFGTPLAGAVFGLEVAAKGKQRYQGILPCLIASSAGHYTTTAWGIKHNYYDIGSIPLFEVSLILKLILAAGLFGLAAMLFTGLTSLLKKQFVRLIPHPAMRGMAGGLLIIALVYLFHTRSYLGLGIPLIEQAFQETVSPFMFLIKTLFTAITLGSGFIGGEVTPLFVIGSTLGSALSAYFLVPAPFLAALGFAAVFGAAAKTPLTCIVLGIELFGIEAAPYLLLACYVSYFASGRTGIYERVKHDT